VVCSIFVSEGFEHCVANMFAMPYGIFMGAEYGWKRALIHNLLPVTLGRQSRRIFRLA
jgi:formate/nitrite transporter FocA (FNT family)